MAAQKKRKFNINLLPQEEFAASTTGRVLHWILSTFRYLVIVTEMVVIGAFISRFYFDSRVADLNEEISQKQDFIKAYSDFEKEFRLTQLKLGIFSQISDKNNEVNPFITEVATRIPNDIRLTKLSVTSNALLDIQGNSLAENSIGQLISNLNDSNYFEDVAILNLDSKSISPFIDFTIQAKVVEKEGN